MRPNALEQFQRLREAPAHHFHRHASDLMTGVAPSSATFSCIGIDDVHAYTYLRSTRDDCEVADNVVQLIDLLPNDLTRGGHGRVLHASQLGPLFRPIDPESRLFVMLLETSNIAVGIVGLERRPGEPEFTNSQLDKLCVLRGAITLSACYALAVALGVDRETTGRHSAPIHALKGLSKREHEVARLLMGGYANLNIAAHLGISENTIRTYIRRLYRKLNVCNRIDLLRAYESATRV